MNRTVTYSVVERKNPNTPEDQGNFMLRCRRVGKWESVKLRNVFSVSVR